MDFQLGHSDIVYEHVNGKVNSTLNKKITRKTNCCIEWISKIVKTKGRSIFWKVFMWTKLWIIIRVISFSVFFSTKISCIFAQIAKKSNNIAFLKFSLYYQSILWKKTRFWKFDISAMVQIPASCAVKVFQFNVECFSSGSNRVVITQEIVLWVSTYCSSLSLCVFFHRS